MEETLLEGIFALSWSRAKLTRTYFRKKNISTIPMNTYVKHVLLLSLKKLPRQINLLGNKVDKIYKRKYLFKQKFFGINTSSVLKTFA